LINILYNRLRHVFYIIIRFHGHTCLVPLIQVCPFSILSNWVVLFHFHPFNVAFYTCIKISAANNRFT
jgi:hypothetical protein